MRHIATLLTDMQLQLLKFGLRNVFTVHLRTHRRKGRNVSKV